MSNRDRDSRVDEMVWSTDIPGPVSLPSSSADSDEDDTELATGKPTGPAEAAAAVTMFDEPDLSQLVRHLGERYRRWHDHVRIPAPTEPASSHLYSATRSSRQERGGRRMLHLGNRIDRVASDHCG
jgi:hypothetical protein